MPVAAIDSEAARARYRSEREACSGWRACAEIDVALAGLEDQEALARLAQVVQATTTESRDLSRLDPGRRAVLAQAIEVLGEKDHTESAAALEELLAKGWSYNPALTVHVAQLKRDVPRLTELAHERGAKGSAALRALLKLGEKNVVEELASDPRYRLRRYAAELSSSGEP